MGTQPMDGSDSCDAVIEAVIGLAMLVSRQDRTLASFTIERWAGGELTGDAYQVSLGQEGAEELPFLRGPSLLEVLQAGSARAQLVEPTDLNPLDAYNPEEIRCSWRALVEHLSVLSPESADLSFLAHSRVAGGPFWLTWIECGSEALEVGAASITLLVEELRQIRAEWQGGAPGPRRPA